jgi:hypothetical protein
MAYEIPFFVGLMKRLIGVEIDNRQAQRVVLHHAGLDFVGKRKPDRGRQIFAA